MNNAPAEHDAANPEADPSHRDSARKSDVIRRFLEAEDGGNGRFREQFLEAHPESAELLASFLDGVDAVCDFLVDGQPQRTELPDDLRELPLGDRFQFREELGRGMFGVVWKAWDTHLQRDVALKFPFRGGNADRDHALAMREAQAASRLRHPHIVGVHEVVQAGGVAFLVTDFIDSRTLDDWIATSRPSLEASLDIVRKVAEALDYAHQQGVTHRDLKPANILVDAHGEPHITDFGLAQIGSRESESQGEKGFVGSPYYMSPEQADGKSTSADARSDVYALGVLLYWLLTGEPPFRGDIDQVLEQHCETLPADPRTRSPGTSRDLSAITLKCLEKSPDRRYQTAGEVADELRRVLKGEPVYARPVPAAVRLSKWACRKPVVASLAGLTTLSVVGVVVTLALLWRHSEMRIVEVQQEKAAHEKTANHLRTSLLHLSWLALEANVHPDGFRLNPGQASIHPAFHQHVPPLNDQLGNRHPSDDHPSNLSTTPALQVAQRGLERFGKPSSPTTLGHQVDLSEAVTAWCQVIVEDDQPLWSRALALHLFAYAAQANNVRWGDWEAMPACLSALPEPSLARLKDDYLSLLIEVGTAEYDNHHSEVARDLLMAAVEMMEQGNRTPAQWIGTKTQLARVYGQLGDYDARQALLSEVARFAEGFDELESIDHDLALVCADVLLLEARIGWRSADIALLDSQTAKAEHFARVALREQGSPQSRAILGRVLDRRARLDLRRGNREEAARRYMEAAEWVEEQPFSTSADSSRRRVKFYALAGNAWSNAGEKRSAARAYTKALEELWAYPQDPRDARQVQMTCLHFWLQWGDAHRARGAYDEARQAYGTVATILERLPEPRLHNEAYASIARMLEAAFQSLPSSSEATVAAQ